VKCKNNSLPRAEYLHFKLQCQPAREDCMREFCSWLIGEALLRVDAGENVQKGIVAQILAKPQGGCHQQ
jgi:hypothetical protein